MPDSVEKKDTNGDSGERKENSFADVVSQSIPSEMLGNIAGQPFTLAFSSATALVTLQRSVLHNAYAHKGLVRTLIDGPIDDALRYGFSIETNGELSEEDVVKLQQEMEIWKDMDAVAQTGKWMRLYGGAACIAANGQNPKTELDLESMEEGDMLAFRAADRWELYFGTVTNEGFLPDDRMTKISSGAVNEADLVRYYNVDIHKSRIIRVNGTEAPSMIRQLIGGYGMSELERCMPEINAYLKFQDMIFELVDEAKLDIYRVNQFTNTLASSKGVERITKHIQLNNQLKNYKSALIMDKEDDYESKQLVFSGLADILVQFRVNLAAALGIPQAKLFGESASGFSSGEDWIENYNSMVEAVRAKLKPLIKQVIRLRCQVLFGYAPETLDIKFPPLRVMSAVEEEQVATSKTNRILSLFDRGVLKVESLEEFLHHERLTTVELEDSAEFRESMLTAGQPKEDGGNSGGKPSGKPKAGNKGKDKDTRKNAVEFLKEQKELWIANSRKHKDK